MGRKGRAFPHSSGAKPRQMPRALANLDSSDDLSPTSWAFYRYALSGAGFLDAIREPAGFNQHGEIATGQSCRHHPNRPIEPVVPTVADFAIVAITATAIHAIPHVSPCGNNIGEAAFAAGRGQIPYAPRKLKGWQARRPDDWYRRISPPCRDCWSPSTCCHRGSRNWAEFQIC
jgi:hypothetical protein